MRVLIDGKPVPESEAGISVFDWGLIRGYGCFEVLHAYGGRALRLDSHVDRLVRSMEIMHMDGPSPEDLHDWIAAQAAEDGGECLVRCFVTLGGRDSLHPTPPRTVTYWEEVPATPDELRYLPLPAPWHAGGQSSEITGAKSLSYAPNMAATLEAQRQGFHDALLLARDGSVLEGPTFCVGWLQKGTLELPGLDLGILASITREIVIELAGRLGLPVREGRFPLDRVLGADEVLAFSTIKEIRPVAYIGDTAVSQGPVAGEMWAEFRKLVSEELGL